MTASSRTPSKRPLICPKGYGLCWTCETWCDMPRQSAPIIDDDVEEDIDDGWPMAGGTSEDWT